MLVMSGFLLSTTTALYSWDGERQGFILGGGLGYGLTSFKNTLSTGEEREQGGAFMTELKIGYATNNQIAMYFTNKSSWFSRDAEETEIRGDDLILSSFTGGGMSYYFKPDTPSLFVSGGMGVLSWREDRTGTHHGYGLFAGGGYEFAKHFSAELNVLHGNPWEANRVITIMATINILGF